MEIIFGCLFGVNGAYVLLLSTGRGLLPCSRPRKPQRPQRSTPISSSRSSAATTGWSAHCSNVSRWNVGTSAGSPSSQGYGHSSNDDGLQALPRRGFKSRILHHSTNQGSDSAQSISRFFQNFIFDLIVVIVVQSCPSFGWILGFNSSLDLFLIYFFFKKLIIRKIVIHLLLSGSRLNAFDYPVFY